MEREELIDAIIKQTAATEGWNPACWYYSATMLKKHRYGILVKGDGDRRISNVYVPIDLKFIEKHFEAVLSPKCYPFSLDESLVLKYGCEY